MTVKELISELEKMPQEARVFHIWDGEPRTAINVVWESKSGHVMTADFEEAVFNELMLPKDNLSYTGLFYKTPKNPNGYTEEDLINT